MQKDVKEKYKQYLDTPEGAKLYNEFKLILYGQPDSLVRYIFEILRTELHDRKTLNILDVGGGDGKRLIYLMDLFEKMGISTTATLVEPSQAFTANLADFLDKRPYPIRTIHSLFEDFASEESYDLILFIHAIFTFRDTTYIDLVQNSLKKNGLVLIASNQPDSLLAQLKTVLDRIHGSKRKEISEVFTDIERAGFTTAAHTTTTSFKDCIEDGRLTQNGKKIIEWLSLRNLDEISQEEMDEARDVFLNNLINGENRESEIIITARL